MGTKRKILKYTIVNLIILGPRSYTLLRANIAPFRGGSSSLHFSSFFFMKSIKN